MSELHVITDLDYGGVQTQLRLGATEATGRGEEVHVASLRWPQDESFVLRDAGVKVHPIGWRFAIDPLATLRLRRLIRLLKPDSVRTWDSASGRFVLATRMPRSTPWVHTVRDMESKRDHLALHADRVVVTCPEIAERLVAARIDRGNLTTISNACEKEIPSDRLAARQQLGLDADAPVIVLATRLDSAVRVQEAAWAADMVRALYPSVRLYVVGDGPYRMACERFAEKGAARGTVRFLGKRADWTTWIAASDVVWCPTDSPGGATPIVQAIAAGRPVVAAHAPGRERLVLEGKAVRLVTWDDRPGWARATDRLLAAAGRASSSVPHLEPGFDSVPGREPEVRHIDHRR